MHVHTYILTYRQTFISTKTHKMQTYIYIYTNTRSYIYTCIHPHICKCKLEYLYKYLTHNIHNYI